MKEIEVKAKIKNKALVLGNLKKLGCKMSQQIFQKDDIFVPQDVREVPTEIGVPVLRIRKNGTKNVLTLKMRLSNGLDKLEKETEISDPKAMEGIILALGFKKISTVFKARIKSKYKNWEVCIDEVEGLGPFIEVEELSEDGDSEKIQKNLFAFLKGLGVRDQDREHHGYDVLLYFKSKKKFKSGKKQAKGRAIKIK